MRREGVVKVVNAIEEGKAMRERDEREETTWELMILHLLSTSLSRSPHPSSSNYTYNIAYRDISYR